MPVLARSHAVTCSPRCRKRRSRAVSVPAELRERPRWVLHTEAKVPVTPDDRPASSTDPDTWSSWERVSEAPRRGFVLDGDGIVCIDLDHCLSGGRLASWAAELLAVVPATFVERSVSGTGLHVWGWAEVEGGRVIRDGRSVEVYGTGRYIAVTGRRWADAPAHLGDIQGLVDRLV